MNNKDKVDIYKKLSEMRKQFSKELKNLSSKDPDMTLILKAKIITVGQVMDELGLNDEIMAEYDLDNMLERMDEEL